MKIRSLALLIFGVHLAGCSSAPPLQSDSAAGRGAPDASESEATAEVEMNQGLNLSVEMLKALEETPPEKQAVAWRPRDIQEQRKIDEKSTYQGFQKLRFNSDEERAMHHFSLGQAYSLANETDKALEAYRTTLIYDPNSALVQSRLAAELVKVGSFAEAKEHCRKAIALDPQFIDGHLLLAGIHVVSKELNEAIAVYRKVLEIKPDHRDALLYYGTTLAEAGNIEPAVAALTRLTKLEDDADAQSDSAIAFYYLAKVEAQRERLGAALKALESSLKVRPGFPKAALFLADIHLAENRQEQAMRVLEASFKETPSPMVAARLAAYHLAESQFAKAVPYLETVVESDSENVSAKVRLALVYWQIEWLDKAVVLLEEVHERFKESSEVRFYLGELELERQKPDKALAYFKAIGPEYPRYEESVARAVQAFLALKKNADARAYVEASIQQKSDIASFYTTYARLLEEEGQVAAAASYLEKNRARIREDESALYYLGYLYDRVGNKTRGLSVMEEILTKNPENPNALNYVGYTLLEEGRDLKRAERLILKAMELKPNDPYILDSYGWLLFKQGNPQLAMKAIEKAVELKPEEGVIQEHLADVYLQLNLPKKAYSAFMQARKFLSDPKEQSRVQGKLDALEERLGLTRRIPASAKK